MSNIPASDVTRLRHMLDAADKIQQFLDGHERTDLETDEMLALAIVRLLEIIGEAAARMSVDVQDELGEIPWAQIVGMRNRLIHGYFDVALDIVWAVVCDDLPDLTEHIRSVLTPLDSST